MASSVLGIGCCICPPNTVPNIHRGQPPIQKFIITSTRGRPSKELFHTHSISRKASRNWFSMNVAAAPISPDYFGTTSDVVSDDDNAAVLKQHSPSSSTLPSRISPWLMLPPAFEEGGNMVYKFYSLKDDKVLSINKRDPGDEAGDDDEPADDSELVGSSHGWLVLYNPRNSDMFLSNPLSRRHIKLPPIHNLPGISKEDLEYGLMCVDSVILSSPPDDKDCRALMIYGPKDSLAFCCPGHGSSSQWTPISKRYLMVSCVYSTTHKLFFCVNDNFHTEVLDICDPSSPKSFPMDVVEEISSWPTLSEEDWFLRRFFCYYSNFLVVADHHPNSTADILLVMRNTMEEMYPCGPSGIKTLTVFDYHYGKTAYPYKTFDFTVHKYDPNKKEWIYMDGSLDGLAIFIGNNHSFAMRASDFPELKADSIYFTDLPGMIFISSAYDPDVCNFGGHDIGIYNYKDKTVSPCYYPCDVQSIKRIEPVPMWFTPSSL